MGMEPGILELRDFLWSTDWANLANVNLGILNFTFVYTQFDFWI